MNRHPATRIVPLNLVCALLMLPGIFAAGCSTTPKPAAADAAPAADHERVIPEVLTVPVAVVRSVHLNDHFVVIEFNQRQPPKPGDELVVMRDNRRVAKVRVTAPTRGAFVTADILDGTVQVGDILP